MAEVVSESFYCPVSRFERVLITFVVMTGFFMAILDTTIVDIVVPKMMGPLSTDLYGIQWVITSYMTAAAAGLIFVVSLAPKIGYAWTFLCGLVLFTSSSIMCGMAQSLAYMIFWRVVQGIGEAFLAASAQTILFAVYPPERRGLAMGIFGLGVSFAPALGPTLGGFLTEHLSWRWIFYINVPVGIVNILAGLFFLPKHLGRTGRFEFNFTSYLFLTAFTVSLLVLLSRGQQLGWFQSTYIGVLAFVSAISLCLYLLSELTSRRPLLDLSIYLVPEFGLTMAYHFFVLGFSMYQVFYLLPLYYENLKGLTTLQAGIHMLYFASFIGLFSVISGALSDRIRPELLLVVSFVLYSVVSVLFLPHFNYFLPAKKAAIYTIPLGIALGTFFPPLTKITLSRLGRRTGLGVVLMHYQRFIGGSFGTAIATNTLTYRTDFHFQEMTGLQNPTLLAGLLKKAEAFFPKAKVAFYQVEYLYAASYAFQDAFRRTYYFALLGAVFLFVLFTRNVVLKRGFRRTALLWTALFLLPASVFSQELSLKDCIDEALRNNPSLREYRYRVVSAERSAEIPFKKHLPRLYTFYQYKRFKDPATIPTPIGNFEVRGEEESVFGVTVKLPVFYGFAVVKEERLRRVFLEVSELEEKKAKEELVLKVVEAFFRVVQAERRLEVAKESLKRRRAHLRNARTLYEEGLVAKHQVLRAELGVKEGEYEVVKAKTELKLAKAYLNTLMGRPASAPLKTKGEFPKDAPVPPKGDAIAEALKSRTDLRLLDFLKKAKELEVELERSRYWPSVDLEFSYVRRGEGMFPSENPYGALEDAWLGLELKWEVWDWGIRTKRVQAKKAELYAVEAKRRALVDLVKLQLEEAYGELEDLKEVLEVARSAAEVAESHFRLASERFREGLADTLEVLDAETELTRAKKELAIALAEYHIARAKLLYACGRIFDYLK